ncbi:MAG TPA: hypothetical protein VLF20_05810 [Patescibacteria group bacterium]|nr:hypothetical protein [Patescibacteria group bacterium]
MANTKKIVLFDIDNTLFNTLRFKQTDLQLFSLYEDALQTITELKDVAELGIFSEGDIAFQQKKLRETNIEQYFLQEHVHIVSEKIAAIETLVKKYKENNKVFLIDDKLSILPVIKKAFPSVFTIWMKRGEYAMIQKPIDGYIPDATIESLPEAVPLIKNY